MQKFLQDLLEKAIKEKASDIHIEAMKDRGRIRFRIDGVLEEAAAYPLESHRSLLSCIKLKGGMDIAEARTPQDGSIRGRTRDIRISTLPMLRGEKAVLRLLQPAEEDLRLEQMEFTGENLSMYKNMYGQGCGLVLITGPTGSGKSTTLYSTLHKLNKIDRNIITIEDPVEVEIAGINQVQVNKAAGLTFAGGLRSVLRQDPDVIAIGEIRDRETADIALKAAVTGHLVLSTLHTNSAAGAVVRLIDMGIPPYMVNAGLKGVLAQRLVRRCFKKADCVNDGMKAGTVDVAADRASDDVPDGVPDSAGKSVIYRGRIALHEVLPIIPAMRSAISGGASEEEIFACARENLPVRTMAEDAERKVALGLTTAEEVLRVTGLAVGTC